MAYIVSTTEGSSAAAATYTVTLGAHASGDLLLVCLSQDGGGTTIAPDATATTAGWATLGTQAASSGSRQAWAWLVADSASEVNPTFTGANDEWLSTMYVIREAHASPFGASPASGTDFVRVDFDFTSVKGSSASGSLNTGAQSNCLLLYSWCLDSAGTSGAALRVSPGEMVTDSSFANNSSTPAIYHITGHVQMGAAGAAPTVTCYASIQDGGNGWVIAIRNAASGKLQKHIRAGCTPIKWYGNFGTTLETQTLNVANNLTGDTINGIAPSSVACTTASVGDAANLPGAATGITTNENTAASWQGIAHDITSTDMSAKVFSLQWSTNSLTSPVGAEGWIVVFSDGTNWAAYRLGYPAQSGLVADVFQRAVIALGAATAYAVSAGSINWAAVTKIGYFQHRVGSVTTAKVFNIKNAMLWDTANLVGGSSLFPAQVSYWSDSLVAGGISGIQTLQGSGQLLGKSKLQIGDGATPTYFDLSAQSFEFPLAYSAGNLTRQWNANALSVGVTIKASASDFIYCTAGVLATTTAQPFTIDSASSTSATYSFAGTSFVGWDVTWKTGVTCSNVTFKSGGIIDFKGADIVNVIANSGTGTALMSASDGFSATGCTFTASTTAVYGIRIAAAGTFDLASTTFSGFTKDIDVTATTGTVTINLAAGQATPTYQTAGATVNIVSSPVYQEAVLTGFIAGSLIQIYDTDYHFTVSGVSVHPSAGAVYSQNGVNYTVISSASTTLHAYGLTIAQASGTLTRVSGSGDASITFSSVSDNGTELFNGTASAGNTVISGSTCTWTDNVAAAANRYIRVRVGRVSGATAKGFVEAMIGTCGVTSGTRSVSYLVAQEDDPTYNTNAIDGPSTYATSGITFTDATTDLVNCNIPGGAVIWATIYACFVHWVSNTTTGIADDITYISAPDPANYICTRMRLKDTSLAGLSVTGGWGRDATTGLSITLWDSTGGAIGFSGDHAVAYSSGSGLTAGQAAELTAAAAATAVATASQVRTELATELAHITEAKKMLRNKRILDATTGIETLYNDDGSVLYTRLVYEDAAGTQTYRDKGADRVERYV